MCNLDDCCVECHDRHVDHCRRVSDYIIKLSLQWEKCKRKAKASSCSLSRLPFHLLRFQLRFQSLLQLLRRPTWTRLPARSHPLVPTSGLSPVYCLGLTRFPCGSCRPRPRLAMVLVPGPVTRPVGGPLPGPCLLPARRLLLILVRLAHCPTSHR